MGIASRLFHESCKRTSAKPVSFSSKDKDGEGIAFSAKTKLAPRDYSEAEIARVAETAGLESGASKILASGVTVKMPRTDCVGVKAREMVSILFGSDWEALSAAEAAAVLRARDLLDAAEAEAEAAEAAV